MLRIRLLNSILLGALAAASAWSQQSAQSLHNQPEMSSAVVAAPLATSYKSTATITALGPGTDVCPTGQFPVAVSGNGIDLFGKYVLTEQMCADPVTGAFAGRFKILHTGTGSYSGDFNGTFFPSGQILEVHATWRITGATGAFSNAAGAGTGKGVADVVNGGPGPGILLLDGSILVPAND